MERPVEDLRKFYRPWRQLIEKDNRSNHFLIERWITSAQKNSIFQQGEDRVRKEDPEYYALLHWIIPDSRYEYTTIELNKPSDFLKICEEKEYETIRSSIIPFVKRDGVNYWLMGSFHDYAETNNPILIDFGGKCENKDNTNIGVTIRGEDEGIWLPRKTCKALRCALRETKEESRGLLTPIVEEALQDISRIVIFKGVDRNKRKQKFFILLLLDDEKVKDIPREFDRTSGRERLGPIRFYRQEDIFNRTYRTSKNVTDLVSYLNNHRI